MQHHPAVAQRAPPGRPMFPSRPAAYRTCLASACATFIDPVLDLFTIGTFGCSRVRLSWRGREDNRPSQVVHFLKPPAFLFQPIAESQVICSLCAFDILADFGKQHGQRAGEPVPQLFQCRVLDVESPVGNAKPDLGEAFFLKRLKCFFAKKGFRLGFFDTAVKDSFYGVTRRCCVCKKFSGQ